MGREDPWLYEKPLAMINPIFFELCEQKSVSVCYGGKCLSAACASTWLRSGPLHATLVRGHQPGHAHDVAGEVVLAAPLHMFRSGVILVC